MVPSGKQVLPSPPLVSPRGHRAVGAKLYLKDLFAAPPSVTMKIERMERSGSLSLQRGWLEGSTLCFHVDVSVLEHGLLHHSSMLLWAQAIPYHVELQTLIIYHLWAWLGQGRPHG